ncbi:MAG: SDR family NAD(P)-dependent oxidoreductase [Chloroflexales bacterium]|nr:SDR family NAD(P)-dependent oxidoreductase [Chloroflexales bacterium]
MPNQQQRRVVVVLGASRGIGRATAQALATTGTYLALAARSVTDLAAVEAAVCASGATAVALPCDATDEAAVQQMITTAAAVTGQIDMLVNSAGSAIITPFDELTLADWEAALRTNLTSVFLACKYAVQHMRAGGLIVNVASVASRQAFPGWAAYTAAKHGLLGFSSAIREELRPRGIRVTTVLPAATDTDLWASLPGDWNRANMLKAEDVARAIAQLADQPAYMTTEELVIGHVAGRL